MDFNENVSKGGSRDWQQVIRLQDLKPEEGPVGGMGLKLVQRPALEGGWFSFERV